MSQQFHKRVIRCAVFLIVFFLLFFILSFSVVFMGSDIRSRVGIEPFYQEEIRPLLLLYKMDFFSIPKILNAELFIPAVDQKEIDLSIFYIYLKKDKLDKLNADLPESGENYVKGFLVFENKTYDVKLRYRGDGVGHWYLPKKSWRIKLKEHQLLWGVNIFNFINPKSTGHFEDAIKFPLAQKLGILAPRNIPVVVFLNSEYMGVYQFLDQPEEIFLRLENKLPGDIYVGDQPFQDTNYSLFKHPEDWAVKPILDNDNASARTRLTFLTDHVSNASQEDFYDFFSMHLGNPYLRFSAFTTFMGSAGPDNRHNHKYYLNPSNGVYEPIEWDTAFFPAADRSLMHSQHDLDALFLLYPTLVYQRNIILYGYLTPEYETAILKEIDDKKELIEYETLHDKYKKSGAGADTWFLTNNEWKDHVAQLPTLVSERFSFLRKEVEKVNLTIFIINNTNTTFLVFDVSGISPVFISNVSVETPFPCISVYKDINFDFGIGSTDQKEKICNSNIVFDIGVLYPGVKDKVITGPNHADFIPGSLRYTYILQFEGKGKKDNNHSLNNLDNITFTSIRNAITATPVQPKIIYLASIEELPEQEETLSYHPWKIPVVPKKTIVLDGEVTLTENLFLNEGDILVIKPNTTIKGASNVSIISYGRIIANGTTAMPIKFVPLTNDTPWGAVVLQGEGANGSIFNHCLFEGGSGARYELVHYTGMLSAYNTQVTINNCIFRDNKIEDDTFNAKYSRVEIRNSEFSNTFSDAFDTDISEGIIEQNTFINVGGDAIDIMTSTPSIKDNYIINAGDKGISIGEMSTPIIINNTILSSNIGIAIKDRSYAVLINNTLINNSIGLTLYEKNWKYGGGGMGEITGTDLCSNAQPLVVQNSSVIRIIQNETMRECTEKKCDFTC